MAMRGMCDADGYDQSASAADAPFRKDDGGGGGERDSGLKIESMLLEEFNYASTTAYQAMEDRARMFNMYLLVVGILGSAFGAIYPLGGGAQLHPADCRGGDCSRRGWRASPSLCC